MTWLFWLIFGVIMLFGFVVFRGAPYVPSHRREVERAFKNLRPLGKMDVLVDAGSGDGVILRLASKRGGRAIGYELNPALVMLARFLSRRDPRVGVKLSDFWLVTLPSETTVVYGFMVQRDIKKIAKKMQDEADRLGRPLDFISYGSAIADRQPIRQLGAHHLYRFEPLQRTKA